MLLSTDVTGCQIAQLVEQVSHLQKLCPSRENEHDKSPLR